MKRISARGLLERESPKYKPSQVIRPFHLKPGDKVLIVKRVSNRERRSNLDDQHANLNNVVVAAGATVVGSYPYVGSGRDPFWIQKAAQRARKLGANVILAETT